MTDQWTPVLHEIGTIIGGAAAVIAAVSSLKNGRSLKNGQHVHTPKIVTKKTRNGGAGTPKKDWFKPPDLS